MKADLSTRNPCVDDVHFKNIRMPRSAKVIYIKWKRIVENHKHFVSLSSCRTVLSTHTCCTQRFDLVAYSDWTAATTWTAWRIRRGMCSRISTPACPTPVQHSKNITLRNIFIEDPMLSPGVIMGNSTNPMKNIIFDSVFFTHGRLPFHTKRFPFNGKVQCDNAVGICNVCPSQIVSTSSLEQSRPSMLYSIP